MAQRWDNDPTYKANRAILKAQRRPCARCGREIDYDSPRFTHANGARMENRAAFDCGHIIDRAIALAQGWDLAMINDLTNLQAEHVRCGRTAGAHLGNQLRGVTPKPRPITSRDW